jgi:alpha-1,6-mannosyltransferase
LDGVTGEGLHRETRAVRPSPSRPPLPASQSVGADAASASGLILPVITGFGAVLAICVGGTLAGTPMDVRLPDAWAFGMGHTSGPVQKLGVAAVLAGVAALLVAWLQVVGYLRRRPGTPVRTVLVVFGLWVLPLLIAPPLFSGDAYSYVAQGTMVLKGINPYHYGPVILKPSDPGLVRMVDPLWLKTSVPYGPLFLGLEAGVVGVARHHVPAAVEGLRLLALAGVLLAAAALPSLARRLGTAPSIAVALAILNPLTLLGLISPGHNDALLAGLLLGGLALFQCGRPALAIGLCALATAIKAPALIGTAFLAWSWIGSQVSWRAKLRVAATVSAITVAVLEVCALVTRMGWGWLTTLGTPGVVRSVLTPTTDLALLSDHLVRLLQVGPDTITLVAVSRAIGYAAAAAIIAWLLWRGRHLGIEVGLGLGLLAVVALGPVVQPWYLAWGLLILAAVDSDRWRTVLIGVSVFATVASLPRFEPLVSSAGLAGELSGLALLVAFVFLSRPGLAARVPFILGGDRKSGSG